MELNEGLKQFTIDSERKQEQEDVELDDATMLNNVLQTLGADEEGKAFVVINREIRDGGKMEQEYIERFDIDDFSLDMVKQTYGPGKYTFRVYYGDSRGIVTKKTLRIAKDPTTPQMPPINTPQQTDLAPLLQTMQQGFEKLLLAITATRNQETQPSRMDMLHEMQLMREIIGVGSTQERQPQLDPVALLKLGAEMAGGGGESSDNAWIVKMIDKFGPLLAAKMEEKGQSQETTPVTKNSQAITTPSTTIQMEDEPMNIVVTQYLNMLKNAAEKREAVDAYADSILASIPAPELPKLEEMLKASDWQKRMSTKTDAIEKYPEWFGNLRDTILAFIEEDKAQAAEEVGKNKTNKTPT